MRVALVDEDVAARQRRIVKVIDERLLLQRQGLEAVGVELHDGSVVDALEQVWAVVFAAGGRRLWRLRWSAGDDGDDNPKREKRVQSVAHS